MNFRVSVAHEAEKVLDRPDRPTEQRIRAPFSLPKTHSIPTVGATHLEGRCQEIRIGGRRILFTVDREAKVIHVLTVDTRGQVYKHS